MPYSNVPDDKQGSMESCVVDLMAQGKSKEQAIAICHAAVVGESAMAIVRAGLALSEASAADYPTVEMAASEGRLLKFENAVLAHATVNANQDGLTSAGLKELAATLPMMPIDVGHDNKQVMGIFTQANVRDWVRKDGAVIKDGELVTTGLIFARNHPEETQEIVDGVRHLSIEAGAERAVFHVDAQTGDVTRYLFGLTAFGAGTTKEPADAEAVFDTEHGLVLISSIKETLNANETAGVSRSDMHRMVRVAFRRSYRDAHTVVDVTSEYLVYERGGKLYQAKYTIGSDGNVAFDAKHVEVTKRYTPVDTRKGMMGENKMEELEKLQKDLADLQAAKAEVDAKVAALEAEVAALKAQAEADKQQAEANTVKAATRAMELSTIFSAERVKELMPQLAGMDETAYTLIVEASKKQPAAVVTQVVVADKQAPQDEGLRGLFG